jgi:pimeloyl-ACP methyl ester carboxylesterase
MAKMASLQDSSGYLMYRSSVLALLVCCFSFHGSAAAGFELEDCRISAGPGYPGIKARCGTFPRPLNPDDPDGEQIQLQVAVVPALNLEPEPDPLVPFAGGPGGGSIEFYAAYFHAFEPVRRDRDILLVDQRGTGDSARMDCPIDDDLIEGQFSHEQTLDFTQSCLEQLPHDPRFFTTSVAVRDLEALRTALGYPELNLLGTSYGSRVAQHYARRYPESSRTVVLDGVVPPQLPLGPGIAIEAQRAVDEIFARCAADAVCNEHFPEVDLDFAAVRSSVAGEPVLVSLLDPVTGRPAEIEFGDNELAAAIRLLAYQPRSIAILPLVIHEAANGNFVPLAAQFQLTVTSLADALALGMHNSVMCTEDLPFIDRDAIDFELLQDTFITAMQYEALDTICSIWPQGPIDDGFNDPLATDIPVLLLSGTADPVTPPSYAEMALVEMTNHSHIVNKQQGHGQLAAGCMPDVIADFIASADPATLDSSCMERAFIMPFFVDFSGPMP